MGPKNPILHCSFSSSSSLLWNSQHHPSFSLVISISTLCNFSTLLRVFSFSFSKPWCFSSFPFLSVYLNSGLSQLFLLFRFEFYSSLSFLGFLTKTCSEMSAVHKSRVLVLWSKSTLRILFYFTGFCYFFSRLLSGFKLLEDFSLCFHLP